jgi:hypothetical protein
VEGSYTGNALQGALSGALTSVAYQKYGEYLNNKNPELRGEFGNDVAKSGNSPESRIDPDLYFCKDYCDDLRPYLSNDIKGIYWENHHYGFDIGGDIYGYRYVLSKGGTSFPISVHTARAFTTGRWVGNGFYYNNRYWHYTEAAYGTWRYIK